MSADETHRTRTLWLCTALHAFTHIYQVALLPLYLLIRRDLHLDNDSDVTLLVTIMGLTYFLPSYPMGILADRFSRKKLLGIGLAINGLGFISLALAPNYFAAIVSVGLAGFGGSFFHPSATALIAQLFPEAPGRALGRLGMGASLGFFFAPLYAGWRAESAGWRAPVLELGVLGLVGAGLFFLLATEHRSPHGEYRQRPKEKIFATRALWFFFIAASVVFSLRDFAGSGMASLGSLFLQHARGYFPQATGLTLGCIFLASTLSNPLLGGLSDHGRLRWTTLAIGIAALMIFLFPRTPAEWIVPELAIYGFFLMASYPMVEAALMESVHDSVRGRVFGLFITSAGFIGNLAHWLVAAWSRNLPSHSPQAYYPIYNRLALLAAASMIGLLCLRALRRRDRGTASGEGGVIDAIRSEAPHLP
jgi:MFS transporter, FSR family, fosmidomycin resistance protein